LNVDNFNFFLKDYNSLDKNHVILQNIYNVNETFKKRVDFFLPSAHFVEKNSTYINFFGLIQRVKFILFPFKNVRSDFKILYILFKNLFDTDANFSTKKIFNKFNFLNFDIFYPNIKNTNFNFFFFNNTLNPVFVTNIYRSNSLLRRSKILNICYKEIKKAYTNFF
jgi:NADH dehydrogenase/NADH:ubiquinone oxidoreductase subunit G